MDHVYTECVLLVELFIYILMINSFEHGFFRSAVSQTQFNAVSRSFYVNQSYENSERKPPSVKHNKHIYPLCYL